VPQHVVPPLPLLKLSQHPNKPLRPLLVPHLLLAVLLLLVPLVPQNQLRLPLLVLLKPLLLPVLPLLALLPLVACKFNTFIGITIIKFI
jgi:hypothetical protein